MGQESNSLEEEIALQHKAQIAKRLREWRRNVLRKTQGELATEIGLNIAQIKKYENPLLQTMPGALSLLALAKTGLNIHWLLTGQGRISISERYDQPTDDEDELTALLKMREAQTLLERFSPHERAALIASILQFVSEAAQVAEMEEQIAQKRARAGGDTPKSENSKKSDNEGG